jgi:hypothetical protein
LDRGCETNAGPIVLRPDAVHFRDASAQMLAVWLIGQSQRRGVLTGVRVQPDQNVKAAMPMIGAGGGDAAKLP